MTKPFNIKIEIRINGIAFNNTMEAHKAVQEQIKKMDYITNISSIKIESCE